MKWLRKFNENSAWFPDFICPVCGHELKFDVEDDTKCSVCGTEMEGWEDENV